MLAPSGGGFILYQAYGNLYAIIGRKAHLLEDKQIPRVGVFDESQGYAGNAGKNQASGARVVNTVGNARENKPRVIRCYNCNGEGHIAKQSTTKKRVKDSERFKDKMLLAQAQEVGVVLNDEQQDFLADSLEKTDDCDDLQLQATINFKADHVDAYDSDCDYAGNLHMFTAYPIPWLRCKPFLKTKNKFETFSKNYVQENELCGCVPWKPSRDFTRPLGQPSWFLKGCCYAKCNRAFIRK
ncbi:integrase, catalytic region, zinc finger, CCHC-type containing protein [Tanacetum coccineum]